MSLPQHIKSFISPLIPYPKRIYNLGGSSIAIFLSLLKEPFIMIEEDEELAERLLRDILFYKRLLHTDDTGCVFLPEPDTSTASGKRAEVVYKLSVEAKKASVITSKDALSNLWLPSSLKEDVLYLKTSMELDRLRLTERLRVLGYEHVSLVTEKGQFSVRQWIFDIFPSTEENPVRVEFFGDVIENMRVFDTETQKSISSIMDCAILPANEPKAGVNIMELIKGYEVFFAESAQEEIGEGHVLSKYAIRDEGVDARLLSIKGCGILPEERKGIEELATSVERLMKENKVIIVSSSVWQAERVGEILKEGGLIAPLLDIKEQVSYEGRISILNGELSAGLFMKGLYILTESEIFKKPPFRPMKSSRTSSLIASLSDLNEGDYVVHNLHGIGRFLGLLRQTVEGSEYDLMSIEYEGGDRLYLPLQAIDKVHKYHSKEGAIPKLDRLGSKKWLRTKEKVKEKIKEMAQRLLRLYAEREVSEGFSFSEDTELHREFDSFFLYKETPDQIRTIEEIKKDMASRKPMDRLLTGDVGYGKTEVAMRAAFRAIYDGKQVSVIVPTTLLCEQHLRTFKDRFSAFPVRIDYLSRFKSKRELQKTIKAIGQGEVDIVIGTHALLAKNIVFQDIGLLIIDEEHRFGVAQKERIKELKKGVDILTLSATPIPRTLQMALSGIRGMSIIETPPEERLSVRCVVSVFSDNIIKEAISKEIQRQGQVFFVHNRVQDIMKVAGYLRNLMPDLRIAVAHGQKTSRELEKIMFEFLNRSVDMLVSSAIIGSGLDIPTANTIIINMADKMGLADLYQLKGRVGRSYQKAFAYFLIPGWNVIHEDARKRLQAVQELSYLGAGLRLAMKDLEIRGAGNLLGPEQSGYIMAVGFDMYIEMLEEAVSELKGIEKKEKVVQAEGRGSSYYLHQTDR
ncbi:MAG: transcription-repair coupling factor [Nitrospirae bacterium]|nr:transcription-repair coupling factor [Nitrospirota bacterium]